MNRPWNDCRGLFVLEQSSRELRNVMLFAIAE